MGKLLHGDRPGGHRGLAAVAFRSLSSALYGLVALYITSLVMDRVLYGLDNAKVAYIISDRFRRSPTPSSPRHGPGRHHPPGPGRLVRGGKEVLMCAFKQRQIVALKRTVKEIDPAAFLIVCDAHEVLGEGFRAAIKQNDL